MTGYEMMVAASLVVGANEIAGGVAEPGWPIVVSALYTRESDAAVLPKELTVRLADPRGAMVSLPFEASPPRHGSEGWVRWSWHVAETATRDLKPGRYTATVLASPRDSTLWISPGTLRVLAPGRADPRARGQVLIQRALLRKHPEEALAEANRLVAANPEDEAAWVARGDLYFSQDMPDSAASSYDRALSVHERGEGLELLQRKRDAFFKLLEKRGGRRDSTDSR
jgi:hypothetical protein